MATTEMIKGRGNSNIPDYMYRSVELLQYYARIVETFRRDGNKRELVIVAEMFNGLMEFVLHAAYDNGVLDEVEGLLRKSAKTVFGQAYEFE